MLPLCDHRDVSPKRSPRDLGIDDLVLNHFSLARDHPIEDRLAAAGAAGFAGIGLYIGQYVALRDDAAFGIDRLAALLDEHDLCLAEIEVLGGWAGGDAAKARCTEFETVAWEMAERFECRYVQAIGPYEGTIDDAGDAYAGLCDRAAAHGLVAGLEFLPFTNIVTPADALAIVDRADRPNGGVCVDIWHHTRGANDVAQIRAIPAAKVTGIQISDGPLVQELDSYYEDCLRRRVPPGEGEMDAVGFVATLLDMGVTVPFSLEVCSEAAWGKPAAEHVGRCGDGLRSVLAEAKARLG